MLPYLFPPGLAGLVVLCSLVRRYSSRGDQSRVSRKALLTAMTRVPIGLEASMRAGGDPGEK
jgi:hypothetical protein